MSATNRGAERHEADFYATPAAAFLPLLEHLPTNVSYWEPSCGDGRLIKWLRESGRAAGGADLYPQSPLWAQGDFLLDYIERDFIITNPPFIIAQEFAAHGLEVASEMMLLLRLNFLASAKRRAWWKAHEPSALFVLSERPSFAIFCTCVESEDGPVGCGHKWSVPADAGRPKVCPECGHDDLKITTSDATDYAWFYFGHRFKGIYHL